MCGASLSDAGCLTATDLDGITVPSGYHASGYDTMMRLSDYGHNASSSAPATLRLKYSYPSMLTNWAALKDAAHLGQLVPDVWVADQTDTGSLVWVKARDTCATPAWRYDRAMQNYELRLCDFHPGVSGPTSCPSPMRLFFHAAPRANLSFSGDWPVGALTVPAATGADFETPPSAELRLRVGRTQPAGWSLAIGVSGAGSHDYESGNVTSYTWTVADRFSLSGKSLCRRGVCRPAGIYAPATPTYVGGANSSAEITITGDVPAGRNEVRLRVVDDAGEYDEAVLTLFVQPCPRNEWR